MGNTFGRLFRLTTFGESHGPGVGGVVDGCPSGLALSVEDIQKELDARRPGKTTGPENSARTGRAEPDRVELLSGVFEGKTTGAPLAFFTANLDHNSDDYEMLRDVFRPGHADMAYAAKFGHRDHRGGGRSSARETFSRVAGGAIAQKFLGTFGIKLCAYTAELGGIPARLVDTEGSSGRPFFSPDPDVIPAWEDRLLAAKREGDSVGGLVSLEVENLPAGLGEPVFDKLDARLAYAVMGIGAVKGVEVGAGFASAKLTGSGNNDQISPGGFLSNNSGGTLGGISTGQSLLLTAAVKPIPSIAREQQTIDSAGNPVTLSVPGRHDSSAIPRIVPVIKAMAALTLADFILLQKARSV